jgi:hypothetical protein
VDDPPENDASEEESLADTEAEWEEISKSFDGEDESLADTEAERTSLEEADRNEKD